MDNVALMPASLLPDKARWQQLASDLPLGDILIVLPRQAKQQRVTWSVVVRLRERGKRVRVMNTAPQQIDN